MNPTRESTVKVNEPESPPPVFSVTPGSTDDTHTSGNKLSVNVSAVALMFTEQTGSAGSERSTALHGARPPALETC